MLHAKILTIDSEIACVGSANMNFRSAGKDEECCVVILSSRVAKELDQRFEFDCEQAVVYDLESWTKRSIFIRIQERAARLVVEQL